MKKTTGASALLGLAALPAFAQSNVTLYGVADVGVGYGKAGDTTFSGIINGVLSGPRFGFKGSEKLGNGLEAVFVLEQGYVVGTGAPNSTRQFHRQAWAGLKGGFGTVGLGRQYAPGYNFAGKFSAGVPGTVFNTQAFLVNAIPGASIHPGTDARWDNSISYKAGKMGGLLAEAIYSFQATQSGDDRTDDDRYGVGIGYATGPVGVGAVYHHSKRPDESLREAYVGGSYDFGAAKLYASWQNAKEDGVVDAKVAYIGVAIPIGSGRLHADVARLSDDQTDDDDSSAISVGYTHDLSKRTTAYVFANRTTNQDNAARGVNAVAAGEDSTSLGLGIRHSF